MAYVKVAIRLDFVTFTVLKLCLVFALIPGAVTVGNTTTGTSSSVALTEESSTQAQNSSSAMECTLLIRDKETTMAELRDIFSKGGIFVYFKLDFNSTFTMYSNSSYVVDPLTWVWAADGKGKLLLTYPFDFEQLSLGTLSYGVFHMNLPVAVPLGGCFQQADDGVKRQMVALLVSELVQSVNDTDMNAGTESLVCFERQLTSEEFDLIGVYAIPLCTYYVFQGSTAYDCWLEDGDNFDSEPMRVRKHGWLGAIFALGFLLALFSPLAASFFIRKNPPVKINDEQYVGLNSDLPLGLKHLLCFSLQDYTLIVAARWMIYVCAFMLIPFIPFIISHATIRDSFAQRTAVAFELLLSKGLVIFCFITINLVFLAIAALFIGLYIYDDKFVANSLVVRVADRRYFGFAWDMPDSIRVPEKQGAHLAVFMFTMLYRTQMAINPAVWTLYFHSIWTYIYGLFGGRGSERMKNACRYFFTFFFLLFVFPFALVAFLILLLFNSVPMFYTLLWTVSKSLSNEIKPSEIVIALCTMFLSFAVLFIFVAAFVYVAELLGYTFIGFVLNSDYAGPFLVVALTVAGYFIKAATTFYDTYCILLKRVMEAAERVDAQSASEQSRLEDRPTDDKRVVDNEGMQMQDQSTNVNRGRSGVSTSDEEGNSGEVEMTQQHENLLSRSSGTPLLQVNEGIPVISLRLFELVVATFQPIYLEVAAILLKLLVIAVVMAFGLATIVFIDGISDLPATVEFIATVIVAGVIPTLALILKSPAREENEGAANAILLETFLKDYAHRNREGDVREQDD
ncbi:uncharacterized protein [Diadema antillarum]|uniref:uncharacterized protein n=1 Tax=Diadema antillarum TaxID=105358 RepID=UPI003A84772F